MPIIKIVEQDLTNPGNSAADTDVVYIPGFVDASQESLYNAEGKYVGIQANKPTLITNSAQFKSLVGVQGARFATDQLYTDLISAQPDGSYIGFDAAAVPYHKVMFNAEELDPSYVIAKELVNAGLPVVYERINKDPDYEKLNVQPEDWKENYTSYYKDADAYVPVKSATPPVLFKEYIEGETAPTKGNVYTRTINTSTLDQTYKFIGKIGETDLSGYINTDGRFTKGCFVRAEDAVKYYNFTRESKSKTTPAFAKDKYYELSVDLIEVAEGQEQPENWGADDFICYSLSDKGAYQKVTFTNDGGVISPSYTGEVDYYTVEAAILTEQPTDWGSSNYYTFASDNYNPVAFKNEPAFAKSTYYEVDDVFGFVLVDESPAVWVPENYFKVVEVPNADNNGDIVIPASYANDFSKYYEIDKIKLSLENEGEAPDFSEDTYYEFTDYINIKSMYEGLANAYDVSREYGLGDMGYVSIKYLTSGGYPTYEYANNAIVSSMIALANHRGDCVALIDHTNNNDRVTNINLADSVYGRVKEDATFDANGEFAAMFTPYMNLNRVTIDNNDDGEASPVNVTLPASVAYLLALADSVKTNANWLAVAGAARGRVPNLQSVPCDKPVTNGAADDMQPRDNIAVNAITNISPYGYTIWGNRTLKDNSVEGNLTATSFLNIRNLVSDVKKLCYTTCKRLTFEQNNDILWVNLKSKLQPTLDRMQSGYGISGYKIVRDTEHEKASEKATLCFKIYLYPVYAVEDFYVTVVLTDDEVSVQ